MLLLPALHAAPAECSARAHAELAVGLACTAPCGQIAADQARRCRPAPAGRPCRPAPAPAARQDALFELLKKDFDAAYAGNRAPFPLFVHAPWFTFVSGPAAGSIWPGAEGTHRDDTRAATWRLGRTFPLLQDAWVRPRANCCVDCPTAPTRSTPPLQDNIEASTRFIEYAQEKEGVWFVTASQLLDWMKNPGAALSPCPPRLPYHSVPAAFSLSSFYPRLAGAPTSAAFSALGRQPTGRACAPASPSLAVPISQMNTTMTCDNLVQLTPPSKAGRPPCPLVPFVETAADVGFPPVGRIVLPDRERAGTLSAPGLQSDPAVPACKAVSLASSRPGGCCSRLCLHGCSPPQPLRAAPHRAAVEYCRQYKAGPVEDIWTVGARVGGQGAVSVKPR